MLPSKTPLYTRYRIDNSERRLTKSPRLFATRNRIPSPTFTNALQLDLYGDHDDFNNVTPQSDLNTSLPEDLGPSFQRLRSPTDNSRCQAPNYTDSSRRIHSKTQITHPPYHNDPEYGSFMETAGPDQIKRCLFSNMTNSMNPRPLLNIMITPCIVAA